MVAFAVSGVRYLWFPLAILVSRPSKGLVVLHPDLGGGVATAYHHHVLQGCFLGWWLCLCVSFVVVFLGYVFLLLSE